MDGFSVHKFGDSNDLCGSCDPLSRARVAKMPGIVANTLKADVAVAIRTIEFLDWVYEMLV